jgi:hypothetical protein
MDSWSRAAEFLWELGGWESEVDADDDHAVDAPRRDRGA